MRRNYEKIILAHHLLRRVPLDPHFRARPVCPREGESDLFDHCKVDRRRGCGFPTKERPTEEKISALGLTRLCTKSRLRVTEKS